MSLAQDGGCVILLEHTVNLGIQGQFNVVQILIFYFAFHHYRFQIQHISINFDKINNPCGLQALQSYYHLALHSANRMDPQPREAMSRQISNRPHLKYRNMTGLCSRHCRLLMIYRGSVIEETCLNQQSKGIVTWHNQLMWYGMLI